MIGKAGAAKIKVEQSDPSGNFGSALPRLEMTFKEFLDKISAGDQNLYLTTQYDDDDEEEEEEESKEEEENVDFVKKEVLKQLFAPPSNQLAEDIPFRPALMGNLIPAQFNMWMGNSKAGTSTGLHHDFQDNLYLLLRGEKQFTVICPSEAQNVYTHGQIEKVHPNGYIKYKGVPESRADGAPLADVILNKMSEIEEAIVKLEEEGAETEEMDKLEEQKNELISQLEKAHGDLGEEDEDEDEDENKENKEKKDKKEPNHFCRVPTPVLHGKEKSNEFPLISNINKFTFTLQPNQMLYLPTGWFHEVFSKSVGSDPKKPGHFAFNFWCHAPTTSSFEKPYEDDWWFQNWDSTEAVLRGDFKVVQLPEGEEDDEEEEEEPVLAPPNKRRKF
uniref:JmjC domain-containing protein n=1 Tax=Arcella intermedia TaxID=1963864 RepID=A0A6B2L4R4_9EUKA